MAAYYTSQAYDAPSTLIWRILTDFARWPEWFPRVSAVELVDGAAAAGAELFAEGETPDAWTRWRICEWTPPLRLVCDHIESNARAASHVQAAYLRFELADDDEGCTLEVEIGADGYGPVGDFFVGLTLGSEVRRLLPELVDAFSEYVVRRIAPSA
jgi:carbon monoxide dehydrogenase subunit G